MKSIVFIPGLWGIDFEIKKLIEILKKKGFKCYEFLYEENSGKALIEDIAKKFDKFIKNIKGEFILVGASFGGLIGSYWLEFLNKNKKCKNCIAVCTPFYGSYTSYLSFRKGIREVTPNSKFLIRLNEKINKSKVKYYILWNPFDLMVFPGVNTKLKTAYESRAIFSFWHAFFAWTNPVSKIIEKMK